MRRRLARLLFRLGYPVAARTLLCDAVAGSVITVEVDEDAE